MLTDRNRKVLKTIVECYINNPDPVGSRLIAKRYEFNLSPASIRNIMADLEELGFLYQPHTSAGRVPTDKGYRFYVDTIRVEEYTVEYDIMFKLKERLENIRHDINRLLEEATSAVSELSHNLAFAIPIKPEGTTLNRIQFYRYRNDKTIAVVITDEGIIEHKVLDVDTRLGQKELNKISEYLNSEYSGWTIDRIKASLYDQMKENSAAFDMLISGALRLCTEALKLPECGIYLSGASEILSIPEFSMMIAEVAKAIEDKHRIIRMLDELIEPGRVKVVIGEENPDHTMRHMTVVASDYCRDGSPAGCVGVIGSKRMDYARVIPMVGVIAQFISASISR